MNLRTRLALWAFHRYVRPALVAFRWHVSGSDSNVYSPEWWALDPADVELVVRGQRRMPGRRP